MVVHDRVGEPFNDKSDSYSNMQDSDILMVSKLKFHLFNREYDSEVLHHAQSYSF